MMGFHCLSIVTQITCFGQSRAKNNGGFIPNYGERYHAGERISTGFVESTVNQVISKCFCKKASE